MKKMVKIGVHLAKLSQNKPGIPLGPLCPLYDDLHFELCTMSWCRQMYSLYFTLLFYTRNVRIQTESPRYF